MKLWSLNTNLFFKEPHQLTKFTLEQYLAENISLQRFNCTILGLKDIVALFANEARLFRFRVFFRACSLLNEVGEPPFFYISDITNSSTLSGKSLRKKSKFFVRTSLNDSRAFFVLAICLDQSV